MLSVYMAVRVRPFPKLPPLGAERVRSLDPDIARVNAKASPRLTPCHWKASRKNCATPWPVSRVGSHFRSTQALPTMSAYDAAWI
jgi:hypothetical protein